MASAFQVGAFQVGAFQMEGGDATDLPFGSTILQRHKVDLVGITKKRYREYKEQFRLDAINAERELKRKKRKEVDEPLGYAKIEYDKYGFEVEAGESAFHAFLRELEAVQQQRIFEQTQAIQSDMAARMQAIDQFNRQAAMEVHAAKMRQFARDTAEEEEALELLMMDD